MQEAEDPLESWVTNGTPPEEANLPYTVMQKLLRFGNEADLIQE